MQILLVDDHTLFREALFHVLNQLESGILILEAANIEEAVTSISRSRNLDLVLLDIDLPGVDGLSALPGLRELAPTLPIVVLSGSEALCHVQLAMDNGAIGYLSKSCSSHEMLAALKIVLQGDVYIPPRLYCKLETKEHPTYQCNDTRSNYPLTARQIEVLELMAQGLPNKLIARSLNVAEGTVKLHIAAVLKVLKARNRTHAVTEATRIGLISPNRETP